MRCLAFPASTASLGTLIMRRNVPSSSLKSYLPRDVGLSRAALDVDSGWSALCLTEAGIDQCATTHRVKVAALHSAGEKEK
jgi:hypothetical protein